MHIHTCMPKCNTSHNVLPNIKNDYSNARTHHEGELVVMMYDHLHNCYCKLEISKYAWNMKLTDKSLHALNSRVNLFKEWMNFNF